MKLLKKILLMLMFLCQKVILFILKKMFVKYIIKMKIKKE